MEGKKTYRVSARLSRLSAFLSVLKENDIIVFFIVQFLFCVISNLVQYFGQVSRCFGSFLICQ